MSKRKSKTADKIQPIKSFSELIMLSRKDKRYEQLAKDASLNLGGPNHSLQAAMEHLEACIFETEGDPEGGEEGIVGEINFVLENY